MITSAITITTLVENEIYQTGIPVDAIFTLPGITNFQNLPVFNRTISDSLGTAGGPAGSYTGTAKFTWPNGQVRTVNFSYTIDP